MNTIHLPYLPLSLSVYGSVAKYSIKKTFIDIGIRSQRVKASTPKAFESTVEVFLSFVLARKLSVGEDHWQWITVFT